MLVTSVGMHAFQADRHTGLHNGGQLQDTHITGDVVDNHA